MNPIPYTLSNDFIALTINNKPFVIMSSDNRFNTVKEFIKARDWEAVERSVDLPKAIEKFSVGNVKVYAGTVTYKNKPVNNTIVNKILEFVKEGFPFEPLANFLNNLMQNPNENSVKQLYSYIERYKLPITNDGMFLAMKSVTRDYLDHHTKTIDNSVGKAPSMPRAECNENENVACARSFHAGNWDYVRSFSSGRVVLVEINPRDVVSCPVDSSYQKLRVCDYKVIAEIEEDNSNLKEFESNLAVNNSYYQATVMKPAPELETPVDMKEIHVDTSLLIDPNFHGFKSLTNDEVIYTYGGKPAPKRDSKGRFVSSTKKLPKRAKNGRFI